MTAPGPVLNKLTKNPLIKAAAEITEAVYALLSGFPESEKWDTAARAHQSSNYMLMNVARAVANSSPTGSESDWGAARREAGALLAMLRFAIKQRFIPSDPELMLKLTQLIEQIDKQTKAAYDRRNAYVQYELSMWQEKYEMWQKLNSEIKR